MNLKEFIPLMALLISVITMVYTMVKKSGEDYVKTLEKRIEAIEEDLKDCITIRDTLQRENIEIFRQIARLKEH